MGIKLDISGGDAPVRRGPRHPRGHQRMVLAIANRQNLAEQAQQTQDLEDATEGMEPPVCAELRDGDYCVREVGHSGRHKFRPINRMVN